MRAIDYVDARAGDRGLTDQGLEHLHRHDTIADNASSGGVVLGSRPTRLDVLDLLAPSAALPLHINGETVSTGAGGAVLGSPINALVWLANTVGPLGISLEPGHVVPAGAP